MRQVEVPSDLPEETIIGFARCHQLEIWLREMVYLETKAVYGPSYWQECEAALKRANVQGIPPEKSRQRDQRHPHMATGENDPLWFISFDSLLKLLYDDQLWPLFETYLTTKKILETKLEELAMIRNRLAHCRGLHRHDLDRVLLLLRELDQGFFRFCASYGDHWRFGHEEEDDPIVRHFAGEGTRRERFGGIDLEQHYMVRPSAGYREAMATGKGRLYHFLIYTRPNSSHYFDYPKILEVSRPYHACVAHLILDSYQKLFHVTIPAVVAPETIIETVEFFYGACQDFRGLNLRAMVSVPERAESEGGVEQLREEFEAYNKPFEEICLEWPHFVVPPSHPYLVLDSSCTPCSFFGA